jgi:hypothetical protein
MLVVEARVTRVGQNGIYLVLGVHCGLLGKASVGHACKNEDKENIFHGVCDRRLKS